MSFHVLRRLIAHAFWSVNTSTKLPGLSCAEVDRDEMEIFLTDLIENCPRLQVSCLPGKARCLRILENIEPVRPLQHLDLSGSPVDSRCCALIGDLDNLRVLRLENCPGVDTASVVSLLAKRRKTLVQFDCGNKLQE